MRGRGPAHIPPPPAQQGSGSAGFPGRSRSGRTARALLGGRGAVIHSCSGGMSVLKLPQVDPEGTASLHESLRCKTSEAASAPECRARVPSSKNPMVAKGTAASPPATPACAAGTSPQLCGRVKRGIANVKRASKAVAVPWPQAAGVAGAQGWSLQRATGPRPRTSAACMPMTASTAGSSLCARWWANTSDWPSLQQGEGRQETLGRRAGTRSGS